MYSCYILPKKLTKILQVGLFVSNLEFLKSLYFVCSVVCNAAT